MSLFAELKRRNVIRVGLAYLVASWLLIEVSSLILDIYNAPGWVSQVIVALLAVGFPVALFFAWAFEITPEGIKRESNIDRTQSITHETAKRLDVVTIVMVVLAGALLVGDRLLAPGGGQAPANLASADGRASIAVLPFVNMSADPANEYFSDGLTETLLHMLAQVKDLRVAARTSAFAFKGTNTDIREIAAKLDVSTVLEGSVQKAGDRVRITAQLIDAENGSHLWSGNFDRDLDDIFAIQDEIANAVATELMKSLLGGTAEPLETVGTRSTAAYDLYLRGLEKRYQYTYTSLPEAVRLFQDALSEDPGFDDARIALAATHMEMAQTGLVGPAEAAAAAQAALTPTLAKDPPPPLAAAYGAYLELLAAGYAIGPEQRESIGERLNAALARAPDDPELLELVGDYTGRFLGDTERSMGLIERALELDPLNSNLMTSYGFRLQRTKRWDDALALYARIREINPSHSYGALGPSDIARARGQFADAVLWGARAMQIDRRDHEIPSLVAETLMMIGGFEEATPWVRRAELLNATGDDTLRVAMAHAYHTGNKARALEIAERVTRERKQNRRGLYRNMVYMYLFIKNERGELDDALAMLERIAPGMTAARLPQPPRDFYDVSVVTTVPVFVAEREDAETRRARAEAVEAAIMAVNPAFEPDDGFRGYQAAIRGDIKEARRQFLDELLDPDERWWLWQLATRDPLGVRVFDHPDMRAAIAEVERRHTAELEKYRAYVASGEIVVP